MRQGHVVVLDVGKTLAKLTLWSPDRQLVERRTRTNVPQIVGDYPSLDVDGIASWLAETLRDFSRQGEIAAIVPVGHGAAACLIADDRLCCAAMDYEAELPRELFAHYRKLRDPFALTGSPALPAGLNLGAQLFWLEALGHSQGQILTWPQFWAWTLSGIAASEVTSLGSHTDLWMPASGGPSPLAVARGWADRLAPLRRAADILGPVSEEWRRRCDLPKDCVVLCGIHDSNAALLAARGHPEVAGRPCTVLSTGTWFVAMRALTRDALVNPAALPEAHDCSLNIDSDGVPVPSSRFMGGREAEILMDGGASELPDDRAVELTIAARAFILPSFQSGVGPYPARKGNWIRQPAGAAERGAAISLYLALMADASLELIGANDSLVIEGRFGGDGVFIRALAALRPDQAVYVSMAIDTVALGALQLVDSALPPRAGLARVAPLQADLTDYAKDWRALAANDETRQVDIA